MSSTLSAPPEWSNQAFQSALLAHSSALPPVEQDIFSRGSAEEVVDLAIRWDAEHRKRSRSRRWASLFHDVVKSVERFFKVISTAIQARPEIASLVWGGIRFVIEVVSKYSELYEKIASALKTVTEDLSFYNDYATILYEKWDRVQQALVNVYGDILHLCTTVYRTFKHPNGKDRSSIRILGLALNPFNKRFDEIIHDLQRHRLIVEREVHHVDRLQDKEREERKLRESTKSEEERDAQTQERADARKARETVDERWKQKQLSRFLESLNPAYYAFAHQRHAKIALPHSGEWLFRTSVFQTWSSREGEDGQILWCNGQAGTGKTILTAITIDRLKQFCEERGNTALAYFYCDFRDPDYRTPEIVFQSLLDQLLRQLPQDSPMLSEVVQWHPHMLSARAPDTESVIKSVLPEFQQVFVVIDALNECLDLNILMPLLEKLGKHLRLLVTSRDREDIRQYLRPYPCIRLNQESTAEDIRAFVDTEVKERLRTGRLVVRDKTLVEELSKVLVDKAEGMFLWVALQLNYVCDQRTDHDVRTALHELPLGLEETYTRSLRQIDALPPRRAARCRRVLGWISGARDRLFIDELAEAVALEEMDEGCWQEDKMVTDPMTLIDDCASLCAVGSTVFKRRRVQLTHASVKDFLCMTELTRIPGTLPLYHMRLPMLHLRLATLCISRSLLGSQRESANHFPILRRWPYVVAPPEICSPEWHIAAASKANDLTSDEWTELVKVFRHFVDDYPFHLEGEIALHIAVRIHHGGLRLSRSLLESGADVHVKDDMGSTPMHLAAGSRSPEAADIIIQLAAYGGDVRVEDCSAVTPLHLAAGHRAQDMYMPGALRLRRAAGGVSLAVCTALLNLGADSRAICSDGCIPMHDAAGSGSPDAASIITLLAKHGSDASARDRHGLTPLHRAAERSSLGACSALLDLGADPKVVSNAGSTPLHSAAESVLSEATPVAKVIKLLVRSGADVTAPDNMGYTPLHRAAKNGSPRACWTLLEHGADPCATGHDGVTPLHLAAGCRSENSTEIAVLLMERGASVSSLDDTGATPLHRATASGSVDMTALLLDCGAMLNAADYFGATPLHHATQSGLRRASEVVELLARRGGCMANKTRVGETPLHWAARAASPDACSKLLELDADPATENTQGDTPLHLAAVSWSPDAGKVISVLAGHGGNVSRFNRLGSTPLHRAVERGSLGTCLAFLMCGADARLVDREGATPLHAAARRSVDAAAMIHILLNVGGGIEHRAASDGTTPLHRAAEFGSFAACKALLKRGADLNATNRAGASPMHLAAGVWPHKPDCVKIIELLVQRGSDVSAVDDTGATPLHYAAKAMNPAACSALIALGADASRLDKDHRAPLHLLARALANCCAPWLPGSEDGVRNLLSSANVVALQLLFAASPTSLTAPDSLRQVPRAYLREAGRTEPRLGNMMMRIWHRAQATVWGHASLVPPDVVPRRRHPIDPESAERPPRGVRARKRSASAPPWQRDAETRVS